MSKEHDKHNWRAFLRSPRAKVLFAVVVVIAALVTLLVILNVLLNGNKSVNNKSSSLSAQEQKQAATLQQAKSDDSMKDKAYKALAQGNTGKADEIYKSAIEAESNVPRKVQLAIDQSGVLYRAGKYQDAIDVAKKAESYSDDKYLIAEWSSRLYEGRKQYALAAQYYTLAGQWVKSPTNLSGLNKAYYDYQATRVAAMEKK